MRSINKKFYFERSAFKVGPLDRFQSRKSKVVRNLSIKDINDVAEALNEE
jgi:hypothetical protein